MFIYHEQFRKEILILLHDVHDKYNQLGFICHVYQTIAIGMCGLLLAKGRPIISICSKFLNIPHDSTEQHEKLMTQYYKAAANVQHYKLNFYNKSRPDKKKPSPRRRRTKP